ncbi:hypothetical protein COCMIDRAFT_39703 [Bipolaris oryzae ATCC 44560]|uniref:Uncharacterized protein n=1 Tax=Bipolaris oryzae ATCC 44560 TaxID=930090 RepID=W6YRY8_COCMI|nr:uncharacterized protein COCMIDRAFT_39703 [Bipolaris oryzae ATCC 44560]EUC42212.1 hypothetical protein COCMIDRAFT_39703 [Bipolaris oryzae ATCC 44560]
MLAQPTKDVRPHANQPSIPIRHRALPPARLCQVSTLTLTLHTAHTYSPIIPGPASCSPPWSRHVSNTPALDPGCMLLSLAAFHVLLRMRCNLRVAKSMVIPAASP